MIVRLEQALNRAAPQMEEWYLVGYEFLRRHYLMWERENPGFTDRIARSVGAAQMRFEHRSSLPSRNQCPMLDAIEGWKPVSQPRRKPHSAPVMNSDKEVSFMPHGGEHDDCG